METNDMATVKMVQMVEKIEAQKNIKYSGVKWKYGDVSNFINENIEPTEKQINFVHNLEKQTGVAFSGNIKSYNDVNNFIKANTTSSENSNNAPSQKQIDFVHSLEDRLCVFFDGDINSRKDVMMFIEKYGVSKPSEKQIKFIKSIESSLQIKFEGKSAKDASDFINKHIDELKSKSSSKQNTEDKKESKENVVTPKMKQIVKYIENSIGTAYTGSLTSFKGVSEFINKFKDQAFGNKN